MANGRFFIWQPRDGNVQSPSDPYNIFSFLKPSFQSCLPLRNLHWNSSSRPVRSISSLYIDLIPDARTASSHLPSTTDHVLSQVSTSQDESLKKERRHQIPGLRQTPYLKIYFVHCEDVDTYRASTRKELQDWVKDHAFASQNGASTDKQENHDAFEWLVVYVTFAPGGGPNTSRPSSNTKGNSEGVKKSSSSRWSTRSSKSVIEKIRSDFNGTSKNTADRVAQVQVPESGSYSSQPDGRSQDGKAGWEDLVSKLKSLILASFDLRVQQYEDDIKEKELQRNLPGWNFNTFFVLKEGLARGFESVGLVEDALTSYHELATSLSTIVDEQLKDQAPEQQTTRFVEYTDDLYHAYVQAIKADQNRDGNPVPSNDRFSYLGATILDTERKPFRDLILANKISIFDFQSYVFARQVSLLLRLANALAPKQAETNTHDGNTTFQAKSDHLAKPSDVERENLVILAEVCQLSLIFITSSAWTIRRDIRALPSTADKSRDHNSISSEPLQEDIIENIVTSWIFSACHCILSATSARSLSLQIDPPLRQLEGTAPSQINRSQITEEEQDARVTQGNHFPRRTSSLSFRSPLTAIPQAREFAASVTSLDALRLLPPGTPHPGAQELAAHRGDLLSLSRRSLNRLAFRCRAWEAGFSGALKRSAQQESYMEDINLSAEPGQQHQSSSDSSSLRAYSTCSGVYNAALKSALKSRDRFLVSYEGLTKTALAHYVIGARSKMAEAMTADLAVLCFQGHNYNAAASYFKQLASFYNGKDWVNLGSTMLEMWAECLQNLNNLKEYITVALRALACADAKLRSSLSFLWSLNDLIAVSAKIDGQIAVPLDHYFGGSELDPYIVHHLDRDGFKTSLRLASMLLESFEASSVRVRIVSLDEHQSELWLSSNRTVVKPGLNRINVGSDAMMPGWYNIDNLMIQAGNIIFVHDSYPPPKSLHLPGARSPASLEPDASQNSKRLLVWTVPQSLRVDVSHSGRIHLSEPRSIVLTVSSGWNDISRGTVSLRAASAGLRLHTAKAHAQNSEGDVAITSQLGSISFNVLAPDERLRITIPYSLESDLDEITLRVETAYATVKGNFSYASNATVVVALPLAVNVRDIFQQHALFSNFTVGTATSSPIRIIRAFFRDSTDFETSTSMSIEDEADVFARQPLSLVAEIRHKPNRRGSHHQNRQKSHGRLHLEVDYRCLNRELYSIIEGDLLNQLALTPLQRFSCVLSQQLLHSVRARFTLQDLETIGVRREVELGRYDHYGWEEMLRGIRLAEAMDLREWLKKWHQDSRVISLDDATNVSPVQHLTVPFDLPEMHVVHTARLCPQEGCLIAHVDASYMALGQALPLELILEHTRHWGSEAEDDRCLHFRYDVHASPDTWLVGGQRSARFSAKEGQQHRFSVLLLPQRTGHLLMPAIDIQPIASPHRDGPRDDQASSTESLISCETDYINRAETILVVPNLSSTTARIKME
ncbi:MAG: hypothetical protein Q9217_005924 [Psora testacea]